MDPNLHQKQAVNHLNRVLDYAPMVAEEGEAEVHLTEEDWQVVADCLFRMHTPKEMIPDAIEEYRLSDDQRHILLETDELTITVDRM